MKRTVSVLASVLVATTSSVAIAGWRSVVPVSINQTARRATGSLGSARNGADATSDIYCYVDAKVSGGGSSPTAGTSIIWGVCVANDAAGTYLACSTQRADLIASMRAINGSSLVTFVANESGYCTQVFVSTGSDFEPPR
jgi:hypothetical protein